MRGEGHFDCLLRWLEGLSTGDCSGLSADAGTACIVRLLRNCMRYVSRKDSKAVAADRKPSYQAVTLADSETALDAFADKWDKTYPAISQI